MLKSKNLKALLILIIIEGLLGVLYLFSIPSMDRNAGLLGVFNIPIGCRRIFNNLAVLSGVPFIVIFHKTRVD